MDSAPSVQFDKYITPDKTYARSFEIISDKKNKFKISIYNEQNKVKLLAVNLNIKSDEYYKEVLINELKNNKYLSLCETTSDMLEELFNLIDNKKYSLIESGNNELILSIDVPMKLIKEISFNLSKKEKDTKTIINDLISENNELRSKIEVLSLQITDLKDDIDYLKNKNPDEKIKELSNKINDKFDNFELKMNQEKLNDKKENQTLISQVNILTKKIIQLEKDLEQEKENNKKILEKLNQKQSAPAPTPNMNNNLQNKKNEEPPFHSSKSENLPNLILETFLGGMFNTSNLGRKGRSKFHEHVLVYSNYKMKDEVYSSGSYLCDHCREEFSKNVDNFHCKPCHFDLCDRCFKISQY